MWLFSMDFLKVILHVVLFLKISCFQLAPTSDTTQSAFVTLLSSMNGIENILTNTDGNEIDNNDSPDATASNELTNESSFSGSGDAGSGLSYNMTSQMSTASSESAALYTEADSGFAYSFQPSSTSSDILNKLNTTQVEISSAESATTNLLEFISSASANAESNFVDIRSTVENRVFTELSKVYTLSSQESSSISTTFDGLLSTGSQESNTNFISNDATNETTKNSMPTILKTDQTPFTEAVTSSMNLFTEKIDDSTSSGFSAFTGIDITKNNTSFFTDVATANEYQESGNGFSSSEFPRNADATTKQQVATTTPLFSDFSLSFGSASVASGRCFAEPYNYKNVELIFPSTPGGGIALSENNCQNESSYLSLRNCSSAGRWMRPLVLDCDAGEEVLETLINDTIHVAIQKVFLLTTVDIPDLLIGSLLNALNVKLETETAVNSIDVDLVLRIADNLQKPIHKNNLSSNTSLFLIRLVQAIAFKEKITTFGTLMHEIGAVRTHLTLLSPNSNKKFFSVNFSRDSIVSNQISIPLSMFFDDISKNKIVVIFFQKKLIQKIPTRNIDGISTGDLVSIMFGNGTLILPTTARNLMQPITVSWNIEREVLLQRNASSVNQNLPYRVLSSCAFLNEASTELSQNGLRSASLGESPKYATCESYQTGVIVLFTTIVFPTVSPSLILTIGYSLMIFGMIQAASVYLSFTAIRNNLLSQVVILILMSASIGSILYLISLFNWSILVTENCYVLAIAYQFFTILTFIYVAWCAFIAQRNTSAPLNWIMYYHQLPLPKRKKKLFRWIGTSFFASAGMTSLSIFISYFETGNLHHYANRESCINHDISLYYGVGIPGAVLISVSLFYGVRAVKVTTLNQEKMEMRFLSNDRIYDEAKKLGESSLACSVLLSIVWFLSYFRFESSNYFYFDTPPLTDYLLGISAIITGCAILICFCLRFNQVRELLRLAIVDKYDYCRKKLVAYSIRRKTKRKMREEYKLRGFSLRSQTFQSSSHFDTSLMTTKFSKKKSSGSFQLSHKNETSNSFSLVSNSGRSNRPTFQTFSKLYVNAADDALEQNSTYLE